jgi:hypothetical protein
VPRFDGIVSKVLTIVREQIVFLAVRVVHAMTREVDHLLGIGSTTFASANSAARENGSARGSAYRVGKTPRCLGRGTWRGPSKLRIIGEMREIETLTRISAHDPPSGARGSEHPVQGIHADTHDDIGSIAMLCRCEPGNAHDPRGRLDGVADILHSEKLVRCKRKAIVR